MSKISIDADGLRGLRKQAANLDAFADLACEWADQAEIAIAALRRELVATQESAADAAYERAAQVCDGYSAEQLKLHNLGVGLGRTHPIHPIVLGRKDGADICAERIRALKGKPLNQEE